MSQGSEARCPTCDAEIWSVRGVQCWTYPHKFHTKPTHAAPASPTPPELGTCTRLVGGKRPHAQTSSCRGWKPIASASTESPTAHWVDAAAEEILQRWIATFPETEVAAEIGLEVPIANIIKKHLPAEPAPRPPVDGKYSIDRPCSACSAGDSEMEYHDHSPPFRKGYGTDTRPPVDQGKELAEQEFLGASVAVWREIDRLMATGPYPGIHMASDLRIMEKCAWERYRGFIDGDTRGR